MPLEFEQINIDDLTTKSDALTGLIGWQNNFGNKKSLMNYGYIQGYKMAADVIIENDYWPDLTVFPVMFCYRQYLELILKNIYRIGLNDDRLYVKRIHKISHNLYALWEVTQTFIFDYLDVYKFDKKKKIEFQKFLLKVVKFFDYYDPTSFNFRYSTTKEQKPSLGDDDIRINLGVLHDVIDAIDEGLFSTYGSDYIDWEEEYQKNKNENIKNFYEHPLISVIVPVYKVEDYLHHCVSSIVSQTYQNLEIILVDDGSPDNCPALCDDWIEKDKRIRVIHKRNGGLSDARNAGIDVANGAWLSFVDSDDYLEPNMYERMVEEAKHTQADMVICNFCWQYADHAEVSPVATKICKTYRNLEYLKSFFVEKPIESTVAWNKLYKRELFFTNEYIRYPKEKLHEDEFTTYKLIYLAKKICIIPDVLYHYVQREKSIMSSFTTKNLQDSIVAVEGYVPWLKKKHLDMRRQIACTYDMFYIAFYLRTLENKDLDPQDEILKSFRQFILVNTPSIWRNSQFSIKKRIRDFLVRTNLMFIASWYHSLKNLLK